MLLKEVSNVRSVHLIRNTVKTEIVCIFIFYFFVTPNFWTEVYDTDKY